MQQEINIGLIYFRAKFYSLKQSMISQKVYMLSLTAFAHFTRIYALCNEGCVFGGIVLIKEAIDSYYVRMVLTYDGIDNLLTYKDDHQEVEYGFELERMLPGGVTQNFAYDDIGRLIDSKTRQSSKVRRERKYHWGSADRLLKTEDNRFGTTTYEYSPTGHLQKGGLFCLIIPT